MNRAIALSLAFATATPLAACIQDESAPNRIGLERPALIPSNERNQEAANKRALEKPAREMPTSGAEFPGQSNAGHSLDTVLTLDNLPVPATTQASQPTPEIGPSTAHAPAVGYDIDDNKNQAIPGHDIAVPGTMYTIDKTWGQVYPMPQYPHRDWVQSTVIYPVGDVPANPEIFHPLFDRPDYQPNHPYGPWGSIGADALEIPWAFGQIVAFPVLYVIGCPYAQKTVRYPSGDPNYNGYLPATSAIAPSPYPGTFQFEAATQPTTAPANQSSPATPDMPSVPVKP